jgi:hypothetical protein
MGQGVMSNPAYCVGVLRHLAEDATLDPTTRLVAAAQTIKSHAAKARANPVARRKMLRALQKEIGRQPVDVFWPEVRRMTAQLMNQSAGYE